MTYHQFFPILTESHSVLPSTYTAAEKGPKTVKPTAEQRDALHAIRDWHRDNSTDPARQTRPFVLAGLAGVGKTVVATLLDDVLPGVNIRRVAPTWKAACVLNEKIPDTATPATSIHNLIYDPKGTRHVKRCAARVSSTNPVTGEPYTVLDHDLCDRDCTEVDFAFNPKEGVPGLLVVDEASMVDARTRADLESLGTPVLYVGDHGQLPPVQGRSIFAERAPDVELTQILRQDSRSPIITLSRVIRDRDPRWLSRAKDLGVPVHASGTYDPRGRGHDVGSSVFIAFKNSEVDALNTRMRSLLKRDPDSPEVGDLVMCRVNLRQQRIFNGQTGVVEAVSSTTPAPRRHGEYPGVHVRIRMNDGRAYAGPVAMLDSAGKTILNRPDDYAAPGVHGFSYAYAMTCHKAQGSEYPHAVIQNGWLPEDSRWAWLYTAVTRAKDDLTFRSAR